jgi:DMSO/TMAO reductase YedYZ molybdopterin-dependent catalytic subunit
MSKEKNFAGTGGFSRRDFLVSAGVFGLAGALGMSKDLLAAGERLIAFPEKTDLILLTSRPPQLETPLRYFKELITPNDALFVRWHISNIPTSVDLDLWKLKIGGNTEKEIGFSMEDLKTKFSKVSLTAVIQCSGNGRSFFDPRVPGGQWGNGAMGNVTWTGVRLKDILEQAGIKAGSVDVAFNGLDSAPLPKVPDFIKSLPVDKAIEDDVIIAYEMNGEPLTMLNGFPVRLVVPGWYATYWVKALSEITVLTKTFEEFWMKPGYRIPDNPCACVPPGSKPQKTIPINRMNTRSLVISPETGMTLKVNRPVNIMGIAFSGGYSIKDVIVSTDGGNTWKQAGLGKDLGKYSWIQWSYQWKPAKKGPRPL